MRNINQKKIRRGFALMLTAALFAEPSLLSAGRLNLQGLSAITAYADSWQGVVKATTLNVRSGPGTSYSAVDSLGNNTAVTVLSQTTGTDGQTWYQISYGNGKTGYARHDFIRQPTVYSASDGNFEAWMTQQGFPESYKNELRGLHQQYPNWVFKAEQTGLDWNEVIREESKVGRNLVYKTSKSSWKSTAQGAFDWAANSWPGFDGAAWQAASSDIISYYMDPRNFLSDTYIFQFELQSYDSSIQTREGLSRIVDGTFLAGDALVPLEGSQIDGGTIVEVPVGTAGTGSTQSSGSVSGKSAGSTSGPGASTGGGGTNTPAGPSADGGYVGSGPGVSGGTQQASDGTVILAPSAALSLSGVLSGTASAFLSGLSGAAAFFENLSSGLFGIRAYAASWKQDNTGWWYQNDDGSYLTGWNWLDGNQDGTAECYYFYENGYMAAATVVDGYPLNADGQWIHGDGTPYTKQTGTGSGQSTGSAGQTVQMKKVPYVDIIMKAAESSGVSPYVLASMILQEQGKKGTSDLISGTADGYAGYYNFFNIGAYAHDGMSAIQAGLQYASQSGSGGRPWNSIEKAIIGGASSYGADYVSVGQDTFYLKKFNVQGTNRYNHQYMTNVPAAANEGAKISEAYSAEAKACAIEFKIPVYQNMPETPCPMPTVDGNPNNKLRSITVAGAELTPSFQMDTESYDVTLSGASASATITAETIDQNASVSGTGTVSLNQGQNTLKLTVTAQNGAVREYTLNINYTGDGSAAGTGTTEPLQPGTSDTPGTGPVTGGTTGTTDGGSGTGTAPDGSSVIIIG